MQVVGLPVSLIHSLECGDGLVQHLAGRILQLLLGVVSRLQVALGGEQGADHAGNLTQQAHARLNQRSGGGQHLTLTVGQGIPVVGGNHTVAVQVRHRAAQEVLGLKHTDVLGVDGDGLVDVEAGRVGLDVAHVELLGHLVHGEHVAVGGDGPTQQRQAHHVRHVAEQRHLLGDAEFHKVTVKHDLARGGAQEVLAAQHDVDFHHRVVDRVGQRVQWVAVRAHDHVVRHGAGLELDGATNQIVKGDVFIRHLDT